MNVSDWWNLGREPVLRCRAGWEMQFLTAHLGEDGRLMWDFTHIQGEPSKDSWESGHRAQESAMQVLSDSLPRGPKSRESEQPC